MAEAPEVSRAGSPESVVLGGGLHGTASGRTFHFPFCGLWRFREGVITEHWLNAYGPEYAARLLAGMPRTDPSSRRTHGGV